MPFLTPLSSIEKVVMVASEANTRRNDPEVSAAILNVSVLVRRLRATGPPELGTLASVIAAWKQREATLNEEINQARGDYEVIAAAAKEWLNVLNGPRERWALERALHRMGDLNEAECLYYKPRESDGGLSAVPGGPGG